MTGRELVQKIMEFILYFRNPAPAAVKKLEEGACMQTLPALIVMYRVNYDISFIS